MSSDVKVVYTIGEDACGLQGDESKGPCQRTIETSFNIDKDVKVINLESLDKNSTVSKGGGRLVELVDGIKLQLNFVAVDIDETDANAFNSILYKLVESVIVPSEETPGEFDVMTKDDFTFEEFCDFMNSFRPSDLKNLREFLTDTPTCSVEIKAKCLKCKKVFKSEESGLLGFFSLICSEYDLYNNYKLHSDLIFNKVLSLSELENLMPFEREIYVTFWKKLS